MCRWAATLVLLHLGPVLQLVVMPHRVTGTQQRWLKYDHSTKHCMQHEPAGACCMLALASHRLWSDREVARCFWQGAIWASGVRQKSP
jgi:hypothetical protein